MLPVYLHIWVVVFPDWGVVFPVWGVVFPDWGVVFPDVFECDLVHRRSVAVLCMFYKIRCDLMHPLYGALPVPFVPVRSHIGTLMRLLAAEPHSVAGLLFPSVFLWNDHSDPVFDGVGLSGFKSRANAFLLA